MTESVLVTGSSGTIGTALVESLLTDGYEVYCTDSVGNRWNSEIDDQTIVADLTRYDSINRLPEDVGLVVHLAANARVHDLVEDPSGAQDNLDMTYNVLEYARLNDVPRVLFSSSREVYGAEGGIVYTEDETSVDECENPYAASKIGGEALVTSYRRCYGIRSSILRFSNVYGRYDASDRVVPLFIALASNDEELAVYGQEKVLDFTFLDDCVAGVRRAVSNFEKASSTTFNIASGRGISLVELAEMITELVDGNSNVVVEPNRSGEVSRHVADISKAQRILGYEPSYSFERGIEETVDWYLDQGDLIDEILE